MNQNILMQLLEDPTSSEDTRDRYPTCCFYARDYILKPDDDDGQPGAATQFFQSLAGPIV